MDTPDTAELQKRLAQAQAACGCWACIGDAERLRETLFVAAMLTLRIRHRRDAAATPADGAEAVTRTCRKLDAQEPACLHDATAAAARTRS